MFSDPRRVLVAGFVSTAAVTFVSLIAPPSLPVTGGPGDYADVLARLLGSVWLVGVVTHVVLGTVILPGLYAGVAYRQLSGPPLLRGLEWGVLLWAIVQLALAPLLGDGFFSAAYGGSGAAASSLIGHLVYGATLGLGVGGTSPAEPRIRTARAARTAGARGWV